MPSDRPTIRVLCADDHPLVRKGIAAILSVEPDMVLVAEASDGGEAVALFKEHRPDVTLMDLRMPGVDGIAAAVAIRAVDPAARIIALTSYDGDQEIYRALSAGVRGYLLKEMVHTDVVNAVRLVHAGRQLVPPAVAERLASHSPLPSAALTAREVEVLSLAAKGFSNKEIADRLGTATGTVKMHVQNILSKLRASDRTHAVTLAVQRGILRLGA
jgi:DNA-binding NarL/FixJ family response regulator